MKGIYFIERNDEIFCALKESKLRLASFGAKDEECIWKILTLLEVLNESVELDERTVALRNEGEQLITLFCEMVDTCYYMYY